MSSLEIRLVRIDIPDSGSITCSLYSNGTKIGNLTSLEYNDPGNYLLIPMQGDLKIIVSSNTETIGSVTFPFTLLNESGCLWLPVLSLDSSDYIDELPDELTTPKILLYFEKKNSEEIEEHVDEVVETKEKLRSLTQNYEEFIQKSKEREMALIRNLEDKESEIQGYLEQLSKSQSRIFALIAEKKHLSDSLARNQIELNCGNINELKEELEITRQDLMKSEMRNEHLLQKLEDISAEWNFIEEEAKHLRESELMSQILQLKQELEFKNKEITLLRTGIPLNPLSDISNKQVSNLERLSFEFSDTIKHTKPCKLTNSVSNEHLAHASFNIENSVQVSMVSEEDNVSANSLYSLPVSRGLSPGLKENFKKSQENEKNPPKGSFRGPTISSQNKSRYIPIVTSRRLNQSVERRPHK